MEYNELGSTGLKVSKLAFGTLTISPLQKNLSVHESLPVMLEAFRRGINFFDTAEGYENYDHLRNFLKHVNRKDVIISTKTYAYSRAQAEKSLKKALAEMDTSYVDLFMLHEQMNEQTIKGHYDAIEYFLEMKEKGIIKAIGISTHFVAGVIATKYFNVIDVVHPIINKAGIGICDGDLKAMEEAIKSIKDSKGIFAMKALAGGNLLNNIDEAFDYILSFKGLDSVAIGMQNINEVIFNVNKFENKQIHDTIIKALDFQNRKLHIGDWCIGCSKCVNLCQQEAIQVINGKAVVSHENCTCCGYCSQVCDEFCIKII